MIVAKQVADLLTLSRGLLVVFFAWLGLVWGVEGLPTAAFLLLYSWTSDALDGPLARRSRVKYRNWLGDHDLEIDILSSVGLLIYLIGAGFVNLLLGVAYLLIWAYIFWRWGIQRSPGMLFQAPIYGWFIWEALRHTPLHGLMVVGWIVAIVVITWPRFPKEVVPGFLEGMRIALGRQKNQP